ncbi:MAG: methylamine dehydrogenase accessory protein MauD [Myxococcales bacterium]|nr:MAG: methylamine dehydrogenase accessory protein MauD [Myxococcales bacterium]
MTALLVSNGVLWVTVVVLAFVILALARQIGVLHERMGPAGALLARSGPMPGEAAPPIETQTLDGQTLVVGGKRENGHRMLLFFLSPTCPVCKTVLPSVLRVAGSEVPAVDVVLASDGPREDHLRYVAENRLEALPYVLSTELGLRYGVGKLPHAILIDAAGVVKAKGLANTREHVESLFEAERLGVASVQDYVAGLESHEHGSTRAAGGDAA